MPSAGDTCARLRALLQRAARHHHRSHSGHLQDRQPRPDLGGHAANPLVREPARTRTRGRIGSQPAAARSHFDGRPTRLRGRHTRFGVARQRRASRRAARSSITGRAAFSPPDPEEPNALVTVCRDDGAQYPESSRHPGRAVRRPRRSQPESLAEPRSRRGRGSTTGCRHFSPRGSTTKRSCGRAKPGRVCTSLSSAAPRGLGCAPNAPDPDRYAQRYAHCDVLVVGGGPAGLAAALAAAERASASSCAMSLPSSAGACSAMPPSASTV